MKKVNKKKNKKMNQAGFTLIELLAVVTIMGILMLVAIPAVSRTIENTRKDTFVDTAKQYVNAAKTMWTADMLECHEGDVTKWVYASGVASDHHYYIPIETNTDNQVSGVVYPTLLDNGGKSAWGNRDVTGYVVIYVKADKVTTSRGEEDYRKISYGICLSDSIHGLVSCKSDTGVVDFNTIKRSDVSSNVSSATHATMKLTADQQKYACREA